MPWENLELRVSYVYCHSYHALVLCPRKRWFFLIVCYPLEIQTYKYLKDVHIGDYYKRLGICSLLQIIWTRIPQNLFAVKLDHSSWLSSLIFHLNKYLLACTWVRRYQNFKSNSIKSNKEYFTPLVKRVCTSLLKTLMGSDNFKYSALHFIVLWVSWSQYSFGANGLVEIQFVKSSSTSALFVTSTRTIVFEHCSFWTCRQTNMQAETTLTYKTLENGRATRALGGEIT